MGAMQRRKGIAREREVVNLHKAAGCPARRLAPLQAFKSNDAADVEIRPQGDDGPAWRLEVKSGQQVPKSVQKWLGGNDGLVLRPDRAEAIVCVPWSKWRVILEALKGS